MKYFLLILSFVLLNSLSAEFLINRTSSTLLTLLFAAILITSFVFLIYKPLKKLL